MLSICAHIAAHIHGNFHHMGNLVSSYEFFDFFNQPHFNHFGGYKREGMLQWRKVHTIFETARAQNEET